MKNHRFLWLRNRTTDNRKCEKARNIKEKRTIEMFSTDSVQCTVLTYESHPKMEKSDGFHIAFFMFEKNKDWKKEVSTERVTYFSHSTVIL